MSATTLNLGEVDDLQGTVEKLWDQGVRTFDLQGEYRQRIETDAVLRITRELSGIAFVGFNARINANGNASHVLVVDDAEASLSGLGLNGGDTTNPKAVADRYSGPRWRSAYEAMDGAGALILGASTVKFSHVSFAFNHSGMCGGALSNQGTGLVTVTDSEFVGNSAYHTGAAIDNLTRGSRLVVHRSYFRNNQSNRGSVVGGPHGQVTIFGRTQATVRHSQFHGEGVAIDAAPGADLTAYENKRNGRTVQPTEPAGEGSFMDKIKHLGRLINFDSRLLVRYGLFPWVRRRS